ncbi:MAG: fatty acid desaturase [Bradymonadia bacterium]|jgi:fatty acid desaturase
MRTKRPRWFRQLAMETVLFATITVLLLLLDWKRFFVWLYLPHVWAAFGVITMIYLQHDGCDKTHAHNHSRNFTERVFGWFTFNDGFHGIHHVHPNLHGSLLREAHDRGVKPDIHPDLDEPSIFAYIRRVFFWPGRRLRCDGTSVALPAPVDDVSWIPDELPSDVSMGAEQTT